MNIVIDVEIELHTAHFLLLVDNTNTINARSYIFKHLQHRHYVLELLPMSFAVTEPIRMFHAAKI